MVAAIITLIVTTPTEAHANPVEISQNAQEVLQRFNDLTQYWANKYMTAHWNYVSNLTDENKEASLKVSTELADITKQIAQEANSFPWQELPDENAKRQFQLFGDLGKSALPEDVST